MLEREGYKPKLSTLIVGADKLEVYKYLVYTLHTMCTFLFMLQHKCEMFGKI